MKPWPKVKLGEGLRHSEKSIELPPDAEAVHENAMFPPPPNPWLETVRNGRSKAQSLKAS